MPKVFTSKSQRIGELGEEIAVKYLKNKGYKILERNYTRKWGEIDIVAEVKRKVHLIEVKSILGQDERHSLIRPEENMHPGKLKRFQRSIETYLSEKKLFEREWQADLVCVYLDQRKKNATVKFYPDIS